MFVTQLLHDIKPLIPGVMSSVSLFTPHDCLCIEEVREAVVVHLRAGARTHLAAPNQAFPKFSQILRNLHESCTPTFAQPPLDVFSLSLRDLPDAVPKRGADRLSSPDASPRRDEVSVTSGVREGIGGAARAPATLEGWWPSPLFLL